MISAQGLRLRLGNRDILDIPQFNLPKGQVTALVGPNGSGKSSLSLPGLPERTWSVFQPSCPRKGGPEGGPGWAR